MVDRARLRYKQVLPSIFVRSSAAFLSPNSPKPAFILKTRKSQLLFQSEVIQTNICPLTDRLQRKFLLLSVKRLKVIQKLKKQLPNHLRNWWKTTTLLNLRSWLQNSKQRSNQRNPNTTFHGELFRRILYLHRVVVLLMEVPRLHCHLMELEDVVSMTFVWKAE